MITKRTKSESLIYCIKQTEILSLLDLMFKSTITNVLQQYKEHSVLAFGHTHLLRLKFRSFSSGEKSEFMGNDVLAQNAQFHVCGTGSEELGLILMCISRGMPFHTVSLVLINGNVQDQHNHSARNWCHLEIWSSEEKTTRLTGTKQDSKGKTFSWPLRGFLMDLTHECQSNFWLKH